MKINHTSLPNSHLQGRLRHKIFHKKLHETFMPTEKRNAESLSFKEENTYLQTNVEAAADAESNLSLCVNLRQKKKVKKKKFHNNATFSNAFSHTTLKVRECSNEHLFVRKDHEANFITFSFRALKL